MVRKMFLSQNVRFSDQYCIDKLLLREAELRKLYRPSRWAHRNLLTYVHTEDPFDKSSQQFIYFREDFVNLEQHEENRLDEYVQRFLHRFRFGIPGILQVCRDPVKLLIIKLTVIYPAYLYMHRCSKQDFRSGYPLLLYTKTGHIRQDNDCGDINSNVFCSCISISPHRFLMRHDDIHHARLYSCVRHSIVGIHKGRQNGSFRRNHHILWHPSGLPCQPAERITVTKKLRQPRANFSYGPHGVWLSDSTNLLNCLILFPF